MKKTKSRKVNKNIEQISLKSKRQKIYIIILIAITAIIFSNTINNDFTNWDDDLYILKNPYIKELNIEGIKNIFTKPVCANYHPFTILTYAIEYKFFGLNPKAYHFTNYILHILNTLLVFFFIKLLSKRIEIAFITALLFAIHPMHVESVAWISERKDVLYTFFFISGLILYVKYLNNNRREKKHLIFTFLLFLASLFSKSAAVIFPLVLLLINYFINKKITSKDIKNIIPFLIFSLLFGIIALITQKEAMPDIKTSYSNFSKLLFIAYSIYFYLIRFIFPHNFSPLHLYPDTETTALALEYYLAPFLLVGFIVLIFLSKKEFKHAFIFGMLFFLVNIILIIQIIPVGQAIVSERYTYVSYIGLSYIFAFIFIKLSEKLKNKILLFFLGFIYIVFLSASTWEQNKVWSNSISLWNKAIEVNPKNAQAYNNRGNAKAYLDDYNSAIDDFSKAIEIKPDYYRAYYNRGLAKDNIHDYLGAIEDYSKSILFNSKNADAYYNRGIAFGKIHKYNEAINDFTKAIQLKPKYSEAYFNRGLANMNLKNFSKAVSDYDKAIKYNQDFADAYNNRGNAKRNIQDHYGAISDYNKAIELNPNYAQAYYNRANAYYALEKFSDAITDYSKTIELNPDIIQAYYNRGLAKYLIDDKVGACKDWRKASSLGYKNASVTIHKYCND